MWNIELKSKDNNIFLFKSKKNKKEEAIEEAQEKVKELGWLHHKYKLYKIIPILKGKF